jgi:hypothetical protein
MTRIQHQAYHLAHVRNTSKQKNVFNVAVVLTEVPNNTQIVADWWLQPTAVGPPMHPKMWGYSTSYSYIHVQVVIAC